MSKWQESDDEDFTTAPVPGKHVHRRGRIDRKKARRLILAGEEASEFVRSLHSRFLDDRADAQLFRRRVYRLPELSQVPLDELAGWSAEDLQDVGLSRANVREAIEARDAAEDLRVRWESARAAATPAILLGQRVRDYLNNQGVDA